MTYADPVGRDFFVEADGAAISMWYPDAGFLIEQGDRLRLSGATAAGDYAPKLEVDPPTVQRLGRGQRVPRSAPTQAQLASGSIDCHSVTLDAVVRAASESQGRVELKLADLYRPTRLLFPVGLDLPGAQGLVGAEVRVRATVAVDVNERRQRLGLRLYAQGLGGPWATSPAWASRNCSASAPRPPRIHGWPSGGRSPTPPRG